jgi:hypothetical protein
MTEVVEEINPSLGGVVKQIENANIGMHLLQFYHRMVKIAWYGTTSAEPHDLPPIHPAAHRHRDGREHPTQPLQKRCDAIDFVHYNPTKRCCNVRSECIPRIRNSQKCSEPDYGLAGRICNSQTGRSLGSTPSAMHLAKPESFKSHQRSASQAAAHVAVMRAVHHARGRYEAVHLPPLVICRIFAAGGIDRHNRG